jgi:hypothetical protein
MGKIKNGIKITKKLNSFKGGTDTVSDKKFNHA